MNQMAKLTWVETKLQFRDWGTVAFGLLLPSVLLVVLAFAYPGFRDPVPELGGLRPVDVYTPIVLVLALVMIGISAIASVLATYRHDGILKRLRTTPVGPARLLAAQLLAQLLVATVGAALAVVAALTVLDVVPPRSWLGVLAGLLLGATSLFGIGLVIGALASSTSVANAIASVTWMPIMLLAGLWFPRDAMPAAMRRVSDFSPGGAGADAMQQAWFEGVVPTSSLGVLAAFALVTGGIAALTFRWD